MEDGRVMTLLSVNYDGNKQKAVLLFYSYDDNKIYKIYDSSGHTPYCLTDASPREIENDPDIKSHPEYTGVDRITKINPFSRKLMILSMVKGKTPTAIGGKPGSLREILRNKKHNVWEDDIRYKFCYTYDMDLKIGREYIIRRHTVIPLESVIPSRFIQTFADVKPEVRKLILELAQEFWTVVKMPRFVAMDIEVESEEHTVPKPKEARYRVIAVSFVGENFRKIYLLEREGFESDVSIEGVETLIYAREDLLLRAVFEEIRKHPIILTYNGDNFDFPYLYHRARKLGITRDNIPFIIVKNEARLVDGIHLDLYRFFQNPAIQTYAFSGAYREYKLDSVANALLGRGKTDLEGVSIGELTSRKLAIYCLNDSQLLYDLATFSNGLVYKLIILMSRISKTPIDEVVRHNISTLVRNLMEYVHRKRGWLIPNREELRKKGSASTVAITRGKKYLGGYVKEPKPGTFFDVYVLDFASLYPSLISVRNLSYETINCEHKECKKNQVPGTSHWVCTKNSGITSEIVNALRLIRIKWFKKKAKDISLPMEIREWYNVVQRAVKVFINASYGVFGAEHFRFYCLPVAESTAAYARLTIKEAMKYAESLGAEVLYGDTDSLFIRGISRDKINKIISWASERFAIDLEIEKHYRFVIFSKRKKNYLGVYDNGKVDIKGLTGKKSNTPPIIKKAFEEATHALSEVMKPEDISLAIEKIKNIIKSTCERLERKNVSIDEVSFATQLTKPLKSYTKTIPQHVVAARQLLKIGREIKPGEYVRYIKTRDSVKAAELASPEEIEPSKYIDYMKSVFSQILEPLDIDFDDLLVKKYGALDRWM